MSEEDDKIHWSYREEDSEWSCQNLATREEAIEEGQGETQGDYFEVFSCKVQMPPFGDFDAADMIERYVQWHECKLWDDYGDKLYENYELKPEPLAELEAAVKPHWDKVGEIFVAWLAKYAGKVHFPVNIERIEREEIPEGEGKNG